MFAEDVDFQSPVTLRSLHKYKLPGLRNNPAEHNPMNINLPLICSLDYYKGRLFIPDWDGDLVVLKAK